MVADLCFVLAWETYLPQILDVGFARKLFERFPYRFRDIQKSEYVNACGDSCHSTSRNIRSREDDGAFLIAYTYYGHPLDETLKNIKKELFE